MTMTMGAISGRNTTIIRGALALNAPTITIAPSVVSNVPVNGIAPHEKSRSRISHIEASCICIASTES